MCDRWIKSLHHCSIKSCVQPGERRDTEGNQEIGDGRIFSLNTVNSWLRRVRPVQLRRCPNRREARNRHKGTSLSSVSTDPGGRSASAASSTNFYPVTAVMCLHGFSTATFQGQYAQRFSTCHQLQYHGAPTDPSHGAVLRLEALTRE